MRVTSIHCVAVQKQPAALDFQYIQKAQIFQQAHGAKLPKPIAGPFLTNAKLPAILC
jgi:hypothetical protein